MFTADAGHLYPPLWMLPGLPYSSSEAEREAWSLALRAARASCQVGFDASVYEQEELKWTQSNYVTPQMHAYDLFFYQQGEGFTVKKYLDDVNARYGGVDSILLWPTYPNIGIDSRNQYDWIRSMPGGVKALKAAIDELHANNVKVLLPYNPWDTSTRRENETDAVALARLAREVGADGFNGDTMAFVKEDFFKGMGAGLAIEPELMGTPAMRNWHTMGWAYWAINNGSNPSQGDKQWPVPHVDFYKYAVDSRWMSHGCERWSKDHTIFMLTAYFNGMGFAAWENVWGVWNGMRERDGELLRRITTVQRFFGREMGLLTVPDFEPFPRELRATTAYGTKYSNGNDTVYMIVNMATTPDLLSLNVTSAEADVHFRDCYRGTPLAITAGGVVQIEVQERDIGCIFATKQQEGEILPEYQAFEARMAQLSATPLGSFSEEWAPLQQTLVDPGPTTPRKVPDEDMVRIPAGTFHFVSRGVEVEGDALPDAVGEQYPWEVHPARGHDKVLNLTAYDISKYPITTAQYADYLNATGYTPKESSRWLKNWDWSSSRPLLPEGIKAQPVVYVSLTEARLYCAWRGLRLPHAYEWQYAAQSNDNRTFPWGSQTGTAAQMPSPTAGYEDPVPANVDAHPDGASPFGVQSLVGNVWQYTDEFRDAHTRAVVLKGSSRYQPGKFGGSAWYFPPAPRLDQHGKYLLMDDAYERAGTVGFRCAGAAGA